MNNITLSAQKELIETSRQIAKKRGTTLNAEFRQWLVEYTKTAKKQPTHRQLIAQIGTVRIGKKISREEMNERR